MIHNSINKLLFFANEGFVIVGDVIPSTFLAELKEVFFPHVDRRVGGIRNILTIYPVARKIATSDAVHSLLSAIVGNEPYVPVRGILFDKTTAPGGSNWKVPYHQDLSIGVCERPSVPVAGYETWSIKDGVVHVQPPAAVLERLVTVRLHLDPCDAETGALRVLSGTHRMGRLSPNDVARCRGEITETVCNVPEGGAMLFRPLLLHASSPATRPDARRRVLHIEFAPADLELPGGLRWFETLAS